MLLFTCLPAFIALAQEDVFTLDEATLRAAEQWARENLDDDTLRALRDVDRDKVRKFLSDIQRQFRGE